MTDAHLQVDVEGVATEAGQGASQQTWRDAVPASIGTVESPPPDAPVWSSVQRLAFRFIFAYLVLYVTGMASEWVGFLVPQVDALWQAIVPWVGTHVLRLAERITVDIAHRSDSTFAYVQLLCIALLAVAVTVVWSIIDRRRPNYAPLHHYLRIGVRYALASWMLLYAGVKIIKSQFPFPYLETLLTPYGKSSPMTLLWTMMGYSTLYNLYAGVAEAAGGVLLFWRRTTTLGALLVVAAMSNVVVLNLSYDVPVKIFSSHLFLLGFFLAAPGLRRVWDALVLGRAVGAEQVEPHAGDRGWRGARLGLKTLVIVAGVGGALALGWLGQRNSGDGRVKPPLHGIWEVTEFARNDQTVPPLLTDSTRWRHLLVDFPGLMSVQVMNGEFQRHRVALDTMARQVAFTAWQDSTKTMAFTYATPHAGFLELVGTMGVDSLRISLRRIGPEGFLLVDRGFRWIRE